MHTPRLVIIGNGMAGARLAEEVVARRTPKLQPIDITMFGDEPYGNYNRILLSGVLSGTHQAQDIFINPLAWYEENNITLHAGVRVERIDCAAQLVFGAGNVVEAYDKLVIATGSSAFVPPLAGLHCSDEGQNSPTPSSQPPMKQGVFVFRTLDDCDGIAKYAEKTKRAAVIGGGLLGLEAARGLASRGLETHV